MGSVVDKQVFVNICPDFAKMSTAQIEDFLCVYKSYLKGEIEDELESTSNGCCTAKPGKPGVCGK